jgi:hypothetical protein
LTTTGEADVVRHDPLNLLVVGAWLNAAKSDGDAATWLPPVRSYRCAYVSRQVGVRRLQRAGAGPPP